MDIDPDVGNFLAGYSLQVQEIVLAVRELVLSMAPGAIEQLDIPARMLAYGYRKTYKDLICVIMPLKVGVNLGFPRGTELPDPDGLLTGSGKRARHIRISSLEQAHQSQVAALLRASIAQLK